MVDVTGLAEYLMLPHHKEEGSVTLFDRKGVLVYNSDDQRDVNQNWSAEDPLLTASLRNNAAGLGIIVLPIDDQQRIVARVPVASIGWIAGANQPLAAAMRHVITGLWVAGGLNLLVALVSAAWAWKTSSKLIYQLGLLQAHAQAIGRGDFAHVAEGTGIRELNDLAAAFNRMGAEVRSAQEDLEAANASLEQRVRERTAELKKSAESLAIEQRRFHEVLDMLPAYVVLLTPDYRVPFANRFFEERFGKSDGRRCYEYLFDRDRALRELPDLRGHEDARAAALGMDGTGRARLRHLRLSVYRYGRLPVDSGDGHRHHRTEGKPKPSWRNTAITSRNWSSSAPRNWKPPRRSFRRSSTS